MCNIKEVIANRICRWVSKEKKDKAKVEKLVCPRVNVFERLKGRIITKEQDKGLKISHAIKIKKEERKGVKKHERNSNKTRHHPSTFKKSTSSQYKEKSPMVKSYNITKVNKIKDNKGELPKTSCILSIGKTISKTFDTYHKKYGFDLFAP